jgi:prepilin-type N-terminal cleavage/methylation domain-containing protein
MTSPAPQRAFTLIELLVVISIIGILGSLIISGVNVARSKSRDAQRRQTLNELRDAIELYKTKNGHYPTSPGTWFTSEPDLEWAGNPDPNWIPNLVTDHDISKLPRDPVGISNPINCDNNTWWGEPETPFYYYDSWSGNGYLLASVCGSETALKTTDSLYDTWLNNAGWGVQDAHTMKLCVSSQSDINIYGVDECGGGASGML